jgi:hypothetical protein
MTKQEIALEQLRWACEAGLPRGAVLSDPAYGNDGKFRTGDGPGPDLRGRHSIEYPGVAARQAKADPHTTSDERSAGPARSDLGSAA